MRSMLVKMEKKNEELLNFDQPTYSFRPNETHDWRQQGPYLVCHSCEIKHAVHIGMGKIMVGMDKEGKPILKKR